MANSQVQGIAPLPFAICDQPSAIFRGFGGTLEPRSIFRTGTLDQ